MIVAEHLTKDYGTVVALRDVSFRVARGEVVGFLGPNGAGKTTTLRILAGSLGPTSGRVLVNGHDIAEHPVRARRSMGYMPEAAPLYPEMRVDEYLAFRARLKGLPRKDQREAVARAARKARVDDVRQTLIGHLSKGYRQRVGLADALLGQPPLLILDEPTAGLDPNQIKDVRDLIRELGEGHTVLLSTHILSEVEQTCDRAIVIDRGRLVAEGTLDELRALRCGRELRLTVRGAGAKARALLQEVAEVSEVVATPHGETTSLEISLVPGSERAPEEVLEQLVSTLNQRGFGIREAVCPTAALDEVFQSLTRPERLQASVEEGGA